MTEEKTVKQDAIEFIGSLETVAFGICFIVFCSRWILGKNHIGLMILFGVLLINNSITTLGYRLMSKMEMNKKNVER